MKLDIAKLKEKGWSDYEIHQAMEVLRNAEMRKHPKIKLLDQNMYWLFLFLAIAGNLAFSIALLPVIITMPDSMMYVIAGFTGVIFGTLCSTLLRMIDILDTKHHVLYMVLVPMAGLVNFFIIVTQSNAAVEQLGFGVTHNPWLLGVIYLILFFIPYFLLLHREGTEWI